MFLAHSKQAHGLRAQGYQEHIENVIRLARQFTSQITSVTPGFEALWRSVWAAAAVHDCGKLAPENQHVLSGATRERLPVPHEDSGVLWLLQVNAVFAALLVYSHHRGLPSISAEKIKPLTDAAVGALRDPRVARRMDQDLPYFQEIYAASGIEVPVPPSSRMDEYRGTAVRIALSCLVDSDHTDTASAAGDARPEKRTSCRWEERIKRLEQYVQSLAATTASPRKGERNTLFRCCLESPLHPFATLEAPVGAGKTLAAMAYLLRLAASHRLRHLFVVLPYTSIIDQNVRVYRSALTLEGENPEDVVAAVHHKAEFEDRTSRLLASHWDSPLVVTTSVQFFETLAANRPGPLRRLHELPGSAIFLDEAHSCLPVHLWRQSWEWMRELTQDWNCHFLLGSGSLPKLWDIKGILETSEPVPSILPDDVRTGMFQCETNRIRLQVCGEKLTLEDAVALMLNQPGPRLCIVNTVNNAAVLARYLRSCNVDTLHLSTALSPRDRERVVRRIENKLGQQDNQNWVLVATSCVEAGMDFSFRTGIREAASLNSLIQAGGRVNRNAEQSRAEVFSVRFEDGYPFNRNPQFNAGRQVLGTCLEGSPDWSDLPELVTDCLSREVVLVPQVEQKASDLARMERTLDYPAVAEHYRVIETGTRTVVVDPEIIRRLKAGQPVDWRTVQMASVQMRAKRADLLGARPLFEGEEDGLYEWHGAYDAEFLGYMAAVLSEEAI